MCFIDFIKGFDEKSVLLYYRFFYIIGKPHIFDEVTRGKRNIQEALNICFFSESLVIYES
jgi:hypothetical protein